MSIADRAKQFAPFSALKGYEELVESQKSIPCEKIEISEEKVAFLSDTIKKIKKGNVIKIKYYDGKCYITKEGIVSKIEVESKVITVIKDKISFYDIYDLSIIEGEI